MPLPMQPPPGNKHRNRRRDRSVVSAVTEGGDAVRVGRGGGARERRSAATGTLQSRARDERSSSWRLREVDLAGRGDEVKHTHWKAGRVGGHLQGGRRASTPVFIRVVTAGSPFSLSGLRTCTAFRITSKRGGFTASRR